MKIRRVDLKSALDLLTSIIKVDKIKPVTELLEISGNIIKMTDNISSVAYQLDYEDNLLSNNCVVSAVKLKTLVGFSKREHIELLFTDDYLIIKADGKYKLPIITDNGQLLSLDIKFPDVSILSYKTVNIDAYKTLKNRCKCSLLSSSSQDLYRYYFFNNKALTTNSETIAIVNDVPCIVQEMYPMQVNDLSLLSGDIKFVVSEKYCFYFNDVFQYLTINTQQGLFPVDIVLGIVNQSVSLDNQILLERNILQSALKRLQAIDNDIFSTNVFTLTIQDGCAIIKSNKGLAEEKLECISVKGRSGFIILSVECVYNIVSLCSKTINISFTSDILYIEDDIGRYIIAGAITGEEA